MANVLYQVEKNCPVCKQSFAVTKVRTRLSMIKQDSDFCTYYKDVNPYYYDIWVCPHCGYAAQDTYFSELPVAGENKIRQFLAARTVNVNFGGERSREQAIATYKLAIFFGELISVAISRLATMYLKLAWLYREGEQQDEEKRSLVKARENYEQALLRERLPIGNMTEVSLEYLIGELYRRSGEPDKALSYLGKVVANPQAKMEKRVFELAREAWHQARDTRKEIAAGTAEKV